MIFNKVKKWHKALKGGIEEIVVTVMKSQIIETKKDNKLKKT